jgi:hypothetical protein
MAIASTNPATGEKFKEFKAFNDAEIEKRLKRAEHAFQQHRRESFPKRAELLISVATLLDREKNELARTMTSADAATTPKTPNAFWKTKSHKRTRVAATFIMSRWDRSWRSCPGIFRSGRCFDLPRPL